jgi:plasmid stability protein
MKTLTVREVPDAVYAFLKEEAGTNCRSLQEQVRWVLAKETRLRTGDFLDGARRWQGRLAGRNLGDTVADIRAGRERTGLNPET